MNQAIFCGHTTPEQDARLLESIEEVEQQLRDIADAARWRYVRDVLASEWRGRTHDDTDEWHFDPVAARRRGETLGEIIDRLIAEQQK